MEIDEKYAPYTDAIRKYLSLSPNEATEFAGDIAVLMSTDILNDLEGLPREYGDAVEQGRNLLRYIEDRISEREGVI